MTNFIFCNIIVSPLKLDERIKQMAIAEMIETNGVLWIVNENGHITRKTGNYKEQSAPEIFAYPERPEIKPEEMVTHTLNGEVIYQDAADERLARWWSDYEDTEQRNAIYAHKWREERKQKIRKIASSYRKQQISQFISRFLKRENTR